jgi:energy-converting hydrogenase Eha subunit A
VKGLSTGLVLFEKSATIEWKSSVYFATVLLYLGLRAIQIGMIMIIMETRFYRRE